MNDKYCVLQDDLKDCGVCSLLSIIKYYNGNISKEYLRELTATTKEGVSALNLLKCAREIGFEAYGIKGKLKDLNEKVLPVIAHVIVNKKYPHFVVVYKINYKKSQVLIMDPAVGFVNYTFSSFIKISTNYYLIMKPKQIIPNLINDNNYFEKTVNVIKKYRSIFLTVIVMSIMYLIISVIESYQFKLLYEESFSENIKIILEILILLIIFKILFNYLRSNLINFFNTILDKILVKDAFYHIINLPYLYYRNHTNGDLLTRLNDLGNIKELLSDFFVSFFVDLLLIIIVIIVMINISVDLSIVTIIFLILYSLTVIINGKRLKKSIKKNYENSSLVNNYLVESLLSFETIKNLSIQKYVYKKFVGKYDSFCNDSKHLMKKLNQENTIKNLFISIGNLMIVYIGINNINNNIFSLTSLITYISLSNYLIDSFKNILNLNFKYQNFKESFSRIRELYNIPKEKMDLTKKINYLDGGIEFNNISYSYDGINNVINSLSLKIVSGEKILIYGNSGSGKSTIMKLLIKYLDCNYKGDIRIGGYDLKDIDLLTLRENICYVSQNEYLYTDSIYENITLGRKIKYERFLDIVNNLYINEIVKNSSLGYHYLIENNGENISGGEKKRIIIARSILQKANIYIYDEVFSEIDVSREREIIKYIFSLFPDKTIIVISHRFSNMDLFSKTIRVGDVNSEFAK